MTMTSYHFEVPRWISVFSILFILFFSYIWIDIARKASNTPFMLLGIFMLIWTLVTAIYTLITGKSPYKMTENK